MTKFIKALEQVSYRHRPDRVFRSFATLAACALFGVMVEEMEAGPRFGDA